MEDFSTPTAAAGYLQKADKILRSQPPPTLGTVTTVARNLSALTNAVMTAPSTLTQEGLTDLLLLRGAALSTLAQLTTRVEKQQQYADGAQQLFAQALQRVGGVHARIGWRYLVAYSCSWELLAVQKENPTIMQKALGISQAALQCVEPLQYDVYVFYVRQLLRYPNTLRPYIHMPQAFQTLVRALGQAAAVSIALLEHYVGSAALAEFGISLPPFRESHCIVNTSNITKDPNTPDHSLEALSFSSGFSGLLHPETRNVNEESVQPQPMAPTITPGTPHMPDIAAWRAGMPFRSGAEWQVGVMQHNLASLCGKALWSLLSYGGTVDTIRSEGMKVMQWVADGLEHKPAVPNFATSTSTPHPSATNTTQSQHLWLAVLGLLQMARITSPAQASAAEAALDLHDAALEYVAAHATCPLVERNTVGKLTSETSSLTTGMRSKATGHEFTSTTVQPSFVIDSSPIDVTVGVTCHTCDTCSSECCSHLHDSMATPTTSSINRHDELHRSQLPMLARTATVPPTSVITPAPVAGRKRERSCSMPPIAGREFVTELDTTPPHYVHHTQQRGRRSIDRHADSSADMDDLSTMNVPANAVEITNWPQTPPRLEETTAASESVLPTPPRTHCIGTATQTLSRSATTGCTSFPTSPLVNGVLRTALASMDLECEQPSASLSLRQADQVDSQTEYNTSPMLADEATVSASPSWTLCSPAASSSSASSSSSWMLTHSAPTSALFLRNSTTCNNADVISTNQRRTRLCQCKHSCNLSYTTNVNNNSSLSSKITARPELLQDISPTQRCIVRVLENDVASLWDTLRSLGVFPVNPLNGIEPIRKLSSPTPFSGAFVMMSPHRPAPSSPARESLWQQPIIDRELMQTQQTLSAPTMSPVRSSSASAVRNRTSAFTPLSPSSSSSGTMAQTTSTIPLPVLSRQQLLQLQMQQLATDGESAGNENVTAPLAPSLHRSQQLRSVTEGANTGLLQQTAVPDLPYDEKRSTPLGSTVICDSSALGPAPASPAYVTENLSLVRATSTQSFSSVSALAATPTNTRTTTSAMAASTGSTRRNVRWRADVLALEDTKRRLRIASYDETSFAPDGSPVFTPPPLPLTSNATETDISPIPSTSAVTVVAATCAAPLPLGFKLPVLRAVGSNNNISTSKGSDTTATEPVQSAATASSPSHQPSELQLQQLQYLLDSYGVDPVVFSPVLPAGRLPPSAGAVARVPGCWPHSLPSLRCVPKHPKPHNVLHVAFDTRMELLFAEASEAQAALATALRGRGERSPLHASAYSANAEHGNTLPAVSPTSSERVVPSLLTPSQTLRQEQLLPDFDREELKDALIAALKRALGAAMEELQQHREFRRYNSPC